MQPVEKCYLDLHKKTGIRQWWWITSTLINHKQLVNWGNLSGHISRGHHVVSLVSVNTHMNPTSFIHCSADKRLPLVRRALSRTTGLKFYAIRQDFNVLPLFGVGDASYAVSWEGSIRRRKESSSTLHH